MKRSCDQLLPGHQHCMHGHVEDCPRPGECDLSPRLGKRESTCDIMMPHFVGSDSPEGCPPNCPTRVAAESKEDKQWPPTTLETK